MQIESVMMPLKSVYITNHSFHHGRPSSIL